MTNDEITLALHYLIGSRYVPTVKAYISELTGRTRIVGPLDRSDRMFDRNRVKIAVDKAGLISAFRFA
ncbi:hypothetical protein SAMN05216593_115106 [Pseudomonas asturiensis]|uniref:Peptidase inhibitor I78 family protein n=1 Tax=Pseudomonas asturiensis TaxID=1190415 RepID=A0A1M7PZ85_9PSED|nr:hypothetical protein [Pseudomonas asturiensis]SHN23046.1 hypothetical protein SAMN05216593_115106 [Pseudomonas asturiensis]